MFPADEEKTFFHQWSTWFFHTSTHVLHVQVAQSISSSWYLLKFRSDVLFVIGDALSYQVFEHFPLMQSFPPIYCSNLTTLTIY